MLCLSQQLHHVLKLVAGGDYLISITTTEDTSHGMNLETQSR